METKLDNTTEPQHDAKLPVSRSALKTGYEAVLRILPVLENVYGDEPIEDDKLLIEKLQNFIKGVEEHFC